MEHINAIAKCEFKPKLSIDQMKLGEWYKVVNIKKIKTTFGDSIFVELEENVIFLPKRLVSVINRSAIEELLSAPGCYIKYIGKKAIEGTANPANSIEFTKNPQ